MGNVTIETEIKCPKCKKMINRDRAAKNKYVSIAYGLKGKWQTGKAFSLGSRR